jgi:hypothetical protein
MFDFWLLPFLSVLELWPLNYRKIPVSFIWNKIDNKSTNIKKNMEEYVYRTWMPPIPDERNRYFSVIQGP